MRHEELATDFNERWPTHLKDELESRVPPRPRLYPRRHQACLTIGVTAMRPRQLPYHLEKNPRNLLTARHVPVSQFRRDKALHQWTNKIETPIEELH